MFALVFFAGKRAPTVDFRQLRHWRRAQWCVNRGIGVVRRSASTAALASCAGVRQPRHRRGAQECVNRSIGVVRRSASTAALAWCAGVRQPQHWRRAQDL
ncbi:hypothetical protein LT42_08030 [Pseudomonas lutea]|uniref:Uncharacterized protein n=1 Tax=Pseudomonas lutea TaxID=243924 RepID=A0A9X0JKH9_9PSED|nr:hypothetical protein LT42_08030 [Pseudomonas lutea]